MIESMRTRLGIIALVLIWGAIVFAPNFFSKDKIPSWLPNKTISYGLDIQGGLHLVLGVDTPGVIGEKVNRLAGSLKENINEKTQNAVSEARVVSENGQDRVELLGDRPAIMKYISENYSGVLQLLSSSEGKVSYQYYDAYVNSLNEQILSQAIEVIRNRIDSFGVAEPYIAAQGSDRIVVQLPGISEADYEQAKELINRAARLEKMIVNQEVPVPELSGWIDEAEKAGGYTLGTQNEGGLKYIDYVKKINQDLKDKLPEQTEVVFQKLENVSDISEGKVPYLVKNDVVFTGDKINDAFVGMDEYGNPVVNFSVASEGRSEFAKLTGDNIDKPMAIILDKVLVSAPNINGRLREGGQITLGTGGAELQKEAEFLTNVLRAGALPAALEQLEERSVGPTLGHDSIEAGKKAGMVGIVLVLIFMMFWYRVGGIVAGIALSVNIFLILVLLTSLGATLTLPGIAGIVLTVGMAVDANVIIFERIKEELTKGSGVGAAIKDGFGHALSAIIDSNVTTVIVCIVLLNYGTGPIRGFAVTLICGVITSMFTAVFLTKTVMDLMVSNGIKTILPYKRG